MQTGFRKPSRRPVSAGSDWWEEWPTDFLRRANSRGDSFGLSGPVGRRAGARDGLVEFGRAGQLHGASRPMVTGQRQRIPRECLWGMYCNTAHCHSGSHWLNGDTCLLYTTVDEARNRAGAEYGLPRNRNPGGGGTGIRACGADLAECA